MSERRLRAADAVHARTFDGELVILDMAHGEYFALDAIGARYWATIERGGTLDEALDEIVAEYDVAREQAAEDLRELEAELIARGLVVTEP